jgi:hypothetical protein
MRTATLLSRQTRRIPYFALAGRVYDEPVSIEEAFAANDLRFKVETGPVHLPVWQGEFRPEDLEEGWRLTKASPQFRTLVRADAPENLREEPFAIVSNRYSIVQNSDVESILEESGWRARAAGSIDGGAKCFAVLDGGPYSSFTAFGGNFNAFPIARWNHDGGGAVRIGLQIWKQTCTNGQRHLAGERMVSIRHIGDKKMDIIYARDVMKEMTSIIESFVAKTITLGEKKLRKQDVSDILEKVFPLRKGTVKNKVEDPALWKRGAVVSILSNPLENPHWFVEGTNGAEMIQAVNEVEQWQTRGMSFNRDRAIINNFRRLDASEFPLTAKAEALVLA